MIYVNLFPYVHLYGECTPSLLPNFISGEFCLFSLNVNNDTLCAFPSITQGYSTSYSSSASCDDCHLIFKLHSLLHLI